jgi:multiple sugar transport system substrate-binding protein
MKNSQKRLALEKILKKFEYEYKDINVKIIARNFDYDNIAAKKIENASGDVDLIFYRYKNNANFFFKNGKAEELSEFWENEKLDKRYGKAIKDYLEINGKIYTVPVNIYHKKFFYSKQIFEKYKLSPPSTWEEFLDVCKILKINNVVPISIVTGDPKEITSLFTYLNIRMNGLDFNKRLLQGEISYKDEKVVAVMETIRSLLEKGYINYIYNYTREETLPYIIRGINGMVLTNDYALSDIPENYTQIISSFNFPSFDGKWDSVEEYSVDTVILSEGSQNKEAAKKLLSFLVREDTEESLNSFFNRSEAFPKMLGQEIVGSFDREAKYADTIYFAELLKKFLFNRNIDETLDKMENFRLTFLKRGSHEGTI